MTVNEEIRLLSRLVGMKIAEDEIEEMPEMEKSALVDFLHDKLQEAAEVA